MSFVPTRGILPPGINKISYYDMKYSLEHPVKATIGTEKYKCIVEWRNGKFIVDEPESSGGKDLGPDPTTLLLSSLATCTIATLRMYIDRKGWDIPAIAVAVNMFHELKEDKNITVIDRDLDFPVPITDEQREKLIHIAKVCPHIKNTGGRNTNPHLCLYQSGDRTRPHIYEGEDIAVAWDPSLCRHAARCATQLPQVFKTLLRGRHG